MLQAVTDLVDSALPSVCHSRPLPCPATEHGDGVEVVAEAGEEGAVLVEKGSGSVEKTCLTPQLLTGLLREADKDFCFRYTGSNGGRNATQLSTYSFMKEVLLILSCFVFLLS